MNISDGLEARLVDSDHKLIRNFRLFFYLGVGKVKKLPAGRRPWGVASSWSEKLYLPSLDLLHVLINQSSAGNAWED